MKALTFLEFWQQSQKGHYTFGKVIKYEKLVSQTFEPEMITELFEWFKWDGGSRYHKSYAEWIVFGAANMYLSVYRTVKSTTLIPKTLNDFISTCTRVDIELEWKEEIWK